MAEAYLRWAARLRVPLHFLLAAAVTYFGRPAPKLLLAGAGLIAAGLALRAWAAGHLRRDASITTTGPYAYVRHPLYLGTALVFAGFALAGARWEMGLLVIGYFAALYLPVMAREERERRTQQPEGYAAYAAAVPALWPRLRAYRGPDAGRFAWARYGENREYRALLGCAALWLLLYLRLLGLF